MLRFLFIYILFSFKKCKKSNLPFCIYNFFFSKFNFVWSFRVYLRHNNLLFMVWNFIFGLAIEATFFLLGFFQYLHTHEVGVVFAANIPVKHPAPFCFSSRLFILVFFVVFPPWYQVLQCNTINYIFLYGFPTKITEILTKCQPFLGPFPWVKQILEGWCGAGKET